MTDNEPSKFEKLITDLELISDMLETGYDDPENAAVIDRSIEILRMIQQWTKAYPRDIFRPVDWEQCHRALRQVDVSGTAMAADCMRYVVEQMESQIEKMS